jgi:hypothetical protein
VGARPPEIEGALVKELPLFVRLKQDFWGLFGAIWLLGGVLMLVIGLPMAWRSGDYTLAAGGLILTAIGGRLFTIAMRRLRLADHLQRDGLSAEAEVIAIEETALRYNRQRQWAIRYRYTDRMGEVHDGRSGYLDPEDVAGWSPGDRGVARFDPRRPATSIWIGRV